MNFKIKKYQELRKRVYRRDNYKCVSCGWQPPDIPEDYNGRYALYDYNYSRCLEIDHIQPQSKGGTNCMDNLQTLCSKCNMSKGAKEVDLWQDHKRKA